MPIAFRRAMAVALLAVAVAGCRFNVPADGYPPSLPQPGFSRDGSPSPSLEIPPPVY